MFTPNISPYSSDRFIPRQNNWINNLTSHRIKQADSIINDTAPIHSLEEKHLNSSYIGSVFSSIFSSQLSEAQKEPMLPIRHIKKTKDRSLENIINRFSPPSPIKTHKPQDLTKCDLLPDPYLSLDAPGITPILYRTPLHWTAQNMMACILDRDIYLRISQYSPRTSPESNGQVVQFNDPYTSSDERLLHSPFSISSINNGSQLVIGRRDGSATTVDVATMHKIRDMTNGNSNSIFCISSATDDIFFTGSSNGYINAYDTRDPSGMIFYKSLGDDHKVTYLAHNHLDTSQLVIGTSKGKIAIWDIFKQDNPNLTFSAHESPIKGISFCPWDPSVFATGSLSQSAKIKLWDVHTGRCIASEPAAGRVMGLFWSTTYKGLISCIGNPSNEIQIWNFNRNRLSHKLTRRLNSIVFPDSDDNGIKHIAHSPDGTQLTINYNEILRTWNLPKRQLQKKKEVPQNPFEKYLIR